MYSLGVGFSSLTGRRPCKTKVSISIFFKFGTLLFHDRMTAVEILNNMILLEKNHNFEKFNHREGFFIILIRLKNSILRKSPIYFVEF